MKVSTFWGSSFFLKLKTYGFVQINWVSWAFDVHADTIMTDTNDANDTIRILFMHLLNDIFDVLAFCVIDSTRWHQTALKLVKMQNTFTFSKFRVLVCSDAIHSTYCWTSTIFITFFISNLISISASYITNYNINTKKVTKNLKRKKIREETITNNQTQ